MKVLELKLGYACNSYCVFCLNKDKRYYKEFPLDSLITKIDEGIKQNCEKLIITGGEPLISKNFLNLITYARQKGIRSLEIQTNGRLLSDEKMVKKLSLFKPIQFLVSLHFPNAKLYQKYCQADGFNQTVNGIKYLVKNKLDVTVNTVIMKPSLPYLGDLVKLLKKLAVKYWQYRFIDGKNVMLEYKKFVPKYSQAAKIIRKIILQNPDMKIYVNEIPVCILGQQFINNLAPVYHRERMNLTIGNKLFTSEEIRGLRFIYPNCEGCISKSNCTGIRKDYYQIYGSDEIKPIKNKR